MADLGQVKPTFVNWLHEKNQLRTYYMPNSPPKGTYGAT